MLYINHIEMLIYPQCTFYENNTNQTIILTLQCPAGFFCMPYNHSYTARIELQMEGEATSGLVLNRHKLAKPLQPVFELHCAGYHALTIHIVLEIILNFYY
jgi:hypothetical protein